jgi:hypothetical protein
MKNAGLLDRAGEKNADGKGSSKSGGDGKSRALAQPEPIRGDEGAPIIGPTNPEREAESPSRLAPPETDHGTLPSLKWSFADCHNRLQPGGPWIRNRGQNQVHLPRPSFPAGIEDRRRRRKPVRSHRLLVLFDAWTDYSTLTTSTGTPEPRFIIPLGVGVLAILGLSRACRVG